MAQETWTKEQFWAGLEKLGEDVVRERIIAKTYNDVRRGLAEEWLRLREEERMEASQSEQIDIARSAKDAAWEAARAAHNANIIATLALIAAAIAIAVSILAIFLSK